MIFDIYYKRMSFISKRRDLSANMVAERLSKGDSSGADYYLKRWLAYNKAYEILWHKILGINNGEVFK